MLSYIIFNGQNRHKNALFRESQKRGIRKGSWDRFLYKFERQIYRLSILRKLFQVVVKKEFREYLTVCNFFPFRKTLCAPLPILYFLLKKLAKKVERTFKEHKAKVGARNMKYDFYLWQRILILNKTLRANFLFPQKVITQYFAEKYDIFTTHANFSWR